MGERVRKKEFRIIIIIWFRFARKHVAKINRSTLCEEHRASRDADKIFQGFHERKSGFHLYLIRSTFLSSLSSHPSFTNRYPVNG